MPTLLEIRQQLADAEILGLKAQQYNDPQYIKEAHALLVPALQYLEDAWAAQGGSSAKRSADRAVTMAKTRVAKITFKSNKVFEDALHVDKSCCDVRKAVTQLERLGIT